MTTVDTLKKRLDALQPAVKQVILTHVPIEDDDDFDDDEDREYALEQEDLFKKRYAEAVEKVGVENITVISIVSAGTPEQIAECKRRRGETATKVL